MTCFTGLLGRTEWINTLKDLGQHNALKLENGKGIVHCITFHTFGISPVHMNLSFNKKKQAIKNLPTPNIWELSKTQVIEWMGKSSKNERHLHWSKTLKILGYIKIHKEVGLKHRLPGLTSRHWFSKSVVVSSNLQFLTSTSYNSNSDAFGGRTIFW